MHPSVMSWLLVGDGIVMVTTSAAAVIEQQSPRKRATSFAIKTSRMFRLVSGFRCQCGLKSLLLDRRNHETLPLSSATTTKQSDGWPIQARCWLEWASVAGVRNK